MIDTSKRLNKQQEKEKVRRRMHVKIDPDNYEYIPAKEPVDYYDDTIPQRVAVYVRVSTDDIRQTTSYELQKKYYEDFVSKHPNWTLAGIYADEGISGTSLKHRDAFNNMIADCKSGKIDLIITKSVSRFARNVMITIGMARDLARLKPPVGIFFESECIFSLNEDSQMALTFQATMAEEESHTRSRSMETSLRMRLDNGIPLTPKLLGYTHDPDGNLIINPDEAPTVKLAFYMYLFGYSTGQIADAFNALGRRSYLGNVNWTPSGILQILRNERHCGDVLTRKTYTEDYRSHRTLKNRGNRPQSRYLNHHDAIISRDDYIAVQRMLDNAKYKNRSILPELRVISSGLLKGFVSINPRWAGFKENEYLQAAASVMDPDEIESGNEKDKKEVRIEVAAGDLDLRGFQVVRSELFDAKNTPFVIFSVKHTKFSNVCVKRFGADNSAELLINPITRKLAIRPVEKGSRNSIIISKISEGRWVPRDIPSSAFGQTLFSLMGWRQDCKYKIHGSLYENDNEMAYIFDGADTEALFNPELLAGMDGISDTPELFSPLTLSGKHIRAIPEKWTSDFGKPFYIHELPLGVIEGQDENDWKLRMEGNLFVTGKMLEVTPFEELRTYIRKELGTISLPEEENE